MAKELKPIGLNVVILPDAPLEKEGEFFIPEQAQKEPLTGTVIAAGPGRVDYKMTVKAGMQVAYPRFAWTEATLYKEDGSPVRVIVIKETELYYCVDDQPEPAEKEGEDGC